MPAHWRFRTVVHPSPHLLLALRTRGKLFSVTLVLSLSLALMNLSTKNRRSFSFLSVHLRLFPSSEVSAVFISYSFSLDSYQHVSISFSCTVPIFLSSTLRFLSVWCLTPFYFAFVFFEKFSFWSAIFFHSHNADTLVECVGERMEISSRVFLLFSSDVLLSFSFAFFWSMLLCSIVQDGLSVHLALVIDIGIFCSALLFRFLDIF